MHSLILNFLLYTSAFLLVTANQQTICYSRDTCKINPQEMKEAIALIPDPASSAEGHHLDPSMYRSPAIFEASDNAQILVRVIGATGLELDAATLMRRLWPYAKQYAVRVFDACQMETSGQAGMVEPVLRWYDGRHIQQLEFRLQMTCHIDKAAYAGPFPGVTTYTASGIQEA